MNLNRQPGLRFIGERADGLRMKVAAPIRSRRPHPRPLSPRERGEGAGAVGVWGREAQAFALGDSPSARAGDDNYSIL